MRISPTAVSDGERMGFTSPAPEAKQSKLNWTAPAGWRAIEPTAFRNPNFVFDAIEGAECYVSTLPAGGGGLLANLNRWRKQMGLEAIDEAALEQLERKTILGQSAVVVDWTGTYSGMGGAPRSQWRLLGGIVSLPRPRP